MKEKMKNKLIFAVFIMLAVTLGNLLYNLFSQKYNAAMAPQNASGNVVILDIGHGDYDGGAVASDGTLEKDINLQIGLKVKDMLTMAGYEVIAIRQDDSVHIGENAATIREKKVSDMENRLSIMKANPDALFISIHQNKFPSEAARGAQVFYNVKKPNSQILAKDIQDALREYVDPSNSRVEKSSGSEYYLLEYSPNEGVIVECGFISNSRELKLLKQEDYQKKIALAILKGVDEFLSSAPEKSADNS